MADGRRLGRRALAGRRRGHHAFRSEGAGILTARDHQDLGSCLLSLGSIGQLNHFHNRNPPPDARRDDQDNPNISWPNYHSGANGDYQRAVAEKPVHDLLSTDKTSSGRIEWFPGIPTRARCRPRRGTASRGSSPWATAR